MVEWTAWWDSSLIDRLGWALLHSLWQGLIVVVAAQMLLAMLRNRDAASRYLVAYGAFLVLALCPIATFALLEVEQPRPTQVAASPEAYSDSSITTATSTTAGPDEADGTGSERGEAAVTTSPSGQKVPTVVDDPPELELEPQLATQHSGGLSSFDSTAASTPSRWSYRRWLEWLLPCLVAIWLTGVVLLSLRLLICWGCIQRLRCHGTRPVPENLQRTLQQFCERLEIHRSVRFVQTGLVRMPSAVGFLRPVILFPAGMLTGLSPEQLEAVLAHELAHIRRHDYLLNLLQNLVETLLFYHPATWWLSQRVRVEREHCCDDLAVAVVGDHVAYANTIPSQITNWENLEILILENNQISELPNEIYALTELKILNLKNNPIDDTQVQQLRASLPQTTILY